jgi:hypothetical protein
MEHPPSTSALATGTAHSANRLRAFTKPPYRDAHRGKLIGARRWSRGRLSTTFENWTVATAEE